MATTSKKRSLVWNYFQVNSDDRYVNLMFIGSTVLLSLNVVNVRFLVSWNFLNIQCSLISCSS